MVALAPRPEGAGHNDTVEEVMSERKSTKEEDTVTETEKKATDGIGLEEIVTQRVEECERALNNIRVGVSTWRATGDALGVGQAIELLSALTAGLEHVKGVIIQRQVADELAENVRRVQDAARKRTGGIGGFGGGGYGFGGIGS